MMAGFLVSVENIGRFGMQRFFWISVLSNKGHFGFGQR